MKKKISSYKSISKPFGFFTFIQDDLQIKNDVKSNSPEKEEYDKMN